jgi:plasmid replication initiation protein
VIESKRRRRQQLFDGHSNQSVVRLPRVLGSTRYALRNYPNPASAGALYQRLTAALNRLTCAIGLASPFLAIIIGCRNCLDEAADLDW